jgi:hypothetical protein
MQPSDHETFHGNDQLDFEKINFAWKTRHLEKAPLIYWVSNPPPPRRGAPINQQGTESWRPREAIPDYPSPQFFIFFPYNIYIYWPLIHAFFP